MTAGPPRLEHRSESGIRLGVVVAACIAWGIAGAIAGISLWPRQASPPPAASRPVASQSAASQPAASQAEADTAAVGLRQEPAAESAPEMGSPPAPPEGAIPAGFHRRLSRFELLWGLSALAGEMFQPCPIAGHEDWQAWQDESSGIVITFFPPLGEEANRLSVEIQPDPEYAELDARVVAFLASISGDDRASQWADDALQQAAAKHVGSAAEFSGFRYTTQWLDDKRVVSISIEQAAEAQPQAGARPMDVPDSPISKPLAENDVGQKLDPKALDPKALDPKALVPKLADARPGKSKRTKSKHPDASPPELVQIDGMHGTKKELLDELSRVIESRPFLERKRGNIETWRWTKFGGHHLDGVSAVFTDLDHGFGVKLTTRILAKKGDEATSIWANLHRTVLAFATGKDPAVVHWWDDNFKRLRSGQTIKLQGTKMDFEAGCSGIDRFSPPYELWTVIRPSSQ